MDGTNATRLTQDVAQDVAPAWSPNGTMVAIVYDGEIRLLDLIGAEVASLGPAGDLPRWSPDGSKLVFVWTAPGKLYLGRFGGSTFQVGRELS